MQPYIGRWNCRYRVPDAQPQAMLAVDAIERGVRLRVLDAYEAAMEAVLENDPAVYVLRRVHVSVSMRVGSNPDEAALSRGWVTQIGTEIARAVGSHADPSNLVRFANNADYTAHFIADLLHGLAWQRWCYGAFLKYRQASKPEAILAVLRGDPRQLPAIFGYLANLGCLRAVLDLLDSEASALLWRDAVAPHAAPPGRGQFQIFVRAALTLITGLELQGDGAIEETRLLDAYTATHPPLPDWADRRSLAFAVWNVLRFAERKGYIHDGIAPELWAAKFPQIAAGLDWLDIQWLEHALAGHVVNAPAAPSPRAPAFTSTPNQQRLLQRLRQILFAAVVGLNHQDPDSESNALRLFAALAAAEPKLASLPATAAMISLLLSCWKALLQLPDPISALQQLRSGRVPKEADNLVAQSDKSLRAAAALGEPAADVLQELLARNPIRLEARPESTIETSCAGLFLLLRGITEARVPQLIARADAGPLELILLGLGLQWAGSEAVRAGVADPGLALWCGLADASTPVADLLAKLDPSRCESLLAVITQLMQDRALIDPSLLIAPDVPPDWIGPLAECQPLAAPLLLTGVHLLRLWSRWLRGVSNSGIPYLLRNFVRRAGSIELRHDRLLVKLNPAPLDTVLEMSGYLSQTPAIPWLGDRPVVFRIERSTR